MIPINMSHANASEIELANVTETNTTKTNSSSHTKKAVCSTIEDARLIGDVEVSLFEFEFFV